ncbi:MAG: hypothetical protein JW820_11375 [Spirochaetales bacterium]|nr:hypothetical protein [Spirochaetales bacterium]
MRRVFLAVALAGMGVLLLSCATSIPVTVTKPAEINMSGNRVIAVLDFRYPEKGRGVTGKDLVEWAVARLLGIDLPDRQSIEERVAEYTTSLVITTLLDTGYFQLVSPEQVARAMGRSLSTRTTAVDIGRVVGAQAIVSGELYLLESEEEQWVDTVTSIDPDTQEQVETIVPMMSRRVQVGMRYQVINTRSGAIVASRSFEDDEKEETAQAKSSSLPSAEKMFQEIIEEFMPAMAKQLAPYQVRETRTLMKDKMDDLRMEQADELVKGRLYDAALELYLEIWDDTANPAAGFNAGILYEITGDLDSAVAQMEEVARRTGDRRSMREYGRLLETRAEYQRLQEQL